MQVFHRASGLVAFVALASTSVPAVVAAEVESEPAAQLELIVVTAARTTSPLAIVTDAKAPRQPVPAHDGADYLKTIAGFNVIRKGGADADPLFRGMAGSRVNILADEANLLGGCGMRMDPPTAYIFPQSYDTIRVLKGPQSVLWGAGGSAATVLFERDPYDVATDSDHFNASVLQGRWGRQDVMAEGLAGTALGYVRVDGSYARADDYDDGHGDQVHSEYERWHTKGALGWTPDDDTLVELSAVVSDGEAAYADRMMDGAKFSREGFALKASRSAVSTLIDTLELQLNYSYIDHVMDNYSLRDFVPSMMMPNRSASNPDRETIGGRLSADLVIGERIDVVVGIDAGDNRHSVRSTMNQSLMPYQSMRRVDDATFEQRGVFTETTWRSTDDRSWIGGARVDHWGVHDDRQTIRQGMMLVPNTTAGAEDEDWLTSAFVRVEQSLRSGTPAETTLFAGVGYSERVADYWERFGNDKQSLTSNSAFYTDPERTAQFDTGIIRAAETYRVSVSVFVNDIGDYVLIDTRVPGKPMNTVVTRSVDARTFGGELEAALRVADHWQLESSLAWTQGENRTDDVALAQMPPVEARVALSYARERWTAGGLLRWVAAQDRVDPGRGNIVGQDIGESDTFTVFSLNAGYSFGSVRVTTGIDNLLDATYAEHLSRSGAMVAGYVQTERVNEPGRLWWLKADLAL